MTVEIRVITQPVVTLVAHTTITDALRKKLQPGLSDPVLQLAPEFGGRACYQSWDKPNPATASNGGYIHNILKQRHLSVLEHSSASFYIEGVSRSLTHELVRHRHFSFSQLSQRYVDSKDVAFVLPPAYEGDAILTQLFAEGRMLDLKEYRLAEDRLVGQGLKKKQAREAARAGLPNCTETKIEVSGNLRAWLEFLIKRDNPAADAEIRRLAKELREHLVMIAPDVFGDDARRLWDDSFAQREARA
ncbi:ThyX-like thymidylate synthase [Gordonia phage BrutonGaster]|uniref:ThyX-like thymidylate synthase n=1 Tax=Gordonia phage BrutonGaster TaxID=2530116 RepID=A0A482JKJ7_9CAUD|nr:thymidylate synthase [Gordonia phage BrutonGaster]QBP33293.1 ThyX-like thymidylate synthase [Gordonia phage BrutonGaster]